MEKTCIVNEFNNYFENIGLKLSNSVPKSKCKFDYYLGKQKSKSIFVDPVLPSDVEKVAKKLKSKTSEGHDGISTKLIKHCIKQISIPLCHIINLSLVSGIVPDAMKIATVIPIFKSGDRHVFNNYRPISILPAFSKIL